MWAGNADNTTGLIFIGGCPRSGTTALTEFLNRDPRIVLGMERYKYIVKKIGPDHFSAEHFFKLDKSETNILRNQYYEELQSKFAKQSVRFMGDKVPNYNLHMVHLAKRFPGCKFIMLVRDLFSVAGSFNVRAMDANDIWPKENDYRLALDLWNKCLENIRDFMETKWNDQLFLVNYERFFSNEINYLERLYEFLEIDLTNKMRKTYRMVTRKWDERKNKLLSLNEKMWEYLSSHKDYALESFCLVHCPQLPRDISTNKKNRILMAPLNIDPPMLRIGDKLFDFVDFGASKGGSIDFGVKKLGGKRGIGIDTDKGKIAAMMDCGYDCILGDALELDFPDKSMKFVIMNHFLEHLKNLSSIKRAVQQATRIATDFVFIRGPYFDADEYLNWLGLKLYWSDWSGHKYHLRISQMAGLLEEAGVIKYECLVSKPVSDSDDLAIHPLNSPRNQHAYDPAVHPKKPTVKFDMPVFREMVVIAALREITYWDKLRNAVRDAHPKPQ